MVRGRPDKPPCAAGPAIRAVVARRDGSGDSATQRPPGPWHATTGCADGPRWAARPRGPLHCSCSPHRGHEAEERGSPRRCDDDDLSQVVAGGRGWRGASGPSEGNRRSAATRLTKRSRARGAPGRPRQPRPPPPARNDVNRTTTAHYPATPRATARSGRGISRLDGGVELSRVAPLLARPIAGALAAAERHMVVDPRGRAVDHHHASLRVALELGGVLQRR